MGTQLNKDVPPFVIVADTPSRVRFVNSEGMRRRGVPLSSINSIKDAFKVVYGKKNGTLSNSLKELNNVELEYTGEEVKQFLDFFKNSKNGILL
jgi:UDP-N-acetylglucosamine acyltransferase